MGIRQDTQSKIDKLQASLDKERGERGIKTQIADQQHRDACAEARRRQIASYVEIRADYDPIIADLEKQIKVLKRKPVPLGNPAAKRRTVPRRSDANNGAVIGRAREKAF